MSTATKVLGLVPARGGSKGLPGKNLRKVAGRSLVARAVDAGLAAPSVDMVVVSSDDPEILSEGRRAGAVTSPRPPELARDETPTIDVVLRELALRPSVATAVLLQPTSPLRGADDVQACLDAYDVDHPVVTVSPVSHPPSWSFHRRPDGALVPVLGWAAIAGRRQDAPETYTLNGSVYVGSRRYLLEHRSFIGPATRSVLMPPERSVDIDSELDLSLARLIASGDGP